MVNFQAWKANVLGKVLDSDGVPQDKGQCSQVPVSWAETLNPGVKWSDMLSPVTGVKDWAGKSTKYFTWIPNITTDINQLPLQGDIMVFDATPKAGYSDQFKNEYGHTGVCDSASATGYTIVQQNAPNYGESVNDSSYPWLLQPCLGWLRSVQVTAANITAPAAIPTPPQSSINVGKILILPKSINSWNVYNVDGPYDLPHAIHVLDPAASGGLNFKILADKGNGVYVINTPAFGDVAIWTQGTVATISSTVPATPIVFKDIVVQKGWGLEAVAVAAGIPNPASPTTWDKIAQANGSNDWQTFNKDLVPNQIVKVPLD